ncbi:SDR family oxidoreductase [Solihabitans fulvus]|uniref:SDR family oxidoreductase n=1 Tax=Solihabitans fulvus TaxID=1892852 RepID=A0A5B2WR93_9PSEU|nr:SDR family oxidoreductase [Solihabitans fulvus]KAA2252979.1 SDR family oxidoreductase [Solihabitans fulvus]
MTRFEGKTALVTGGRTGIGFYIASALVEQGARVVLTARSADKLQEVADGFGADRAIAVAGDTNDPEHREAAVQTAIERFGSLDLLVNNTGGAEEFGVPAVEADLAAFRATMEINVVATLGWTQVAWRAWLGEHGGAVLNVSSIAGEVAIPGGAAYSAAKAALTHLTRQLAFELAPTVRVNSIAPAIVPTDLSRAYYGSREQELTATYPLGRFAEPGDLGAAATFLLSDDAAWITGQSLVLDGGRLLNHGTL